MEYNSIMIIWYDFIWIQLILIMSFVVQVRGKDGVGAKMDHMELEREKGRFFLARCRLNPFAPEMDQRSIPKNVTHVQLRMFWGLELVLQCSPLETLYWRDLQAEKKSYIYYVKDQVGDGQLICIVQVLWGYHLRIAGLGWLSVTASSIRLQCLHAWVGPTFEMFKIAAHLYEVSKHFYTRTKYF